LDHSILPALGRRRFAAPDLTAHGRPTSSLTLDELLAAAHQRAPVAPVPESDPMVQVNGARGMAKTNLHRAGVNTAPIDEATQSPRDYRQNLAKVGRDRLELDRKFTSAVPTPRPGMGMGMRMGMGMGNNPHDVLTMRLKTSLTMLKREKQGHRARDKRGRRAVLPSHIVRHLS